MNLCLSKCFFNRAKQQTLIVDKSQPSPADGVRGSVCCQSSKEKVYKLSFKTGNLLSYYQSKFFCRKNDVIGKGQKISEANYPVLLSS